MNSQKQSNFETTTKQNQTNSHDNNTDDDDHGGIFDDADDDDDDFSGFEPDPMPAVKLHTAKNTTSSANSSVITGNDTIKKKMNYKNNKNNNGKDKRLAMIRNIVTGSSPTKKIPSPSIAARKLSLPLAVETITSSPLTSSKVSGGDNMSQKDDNSIKSKEKTKQRKRSLQPQRRVLHGKKDAAHATKLLRNVNDLGAVLSDDDCRFLAEHFWIFSINQLQYVLNETTPDQNLMNQITNTLAAKYSDKKPSSSSDERNVQIKLEDTNSAGNNKTRTHSGTEEAAQSDKNTAGANATSEDRQEKDLANGDRTTHLTGDTNVRIKVEEDVKENDDGIKNLLSPEEMDVDTTLDSQEVPQISNSKKKTSKKKSLDSVEAKEAAASIEKKSIASEEKMTATSKQNGDTIDSKGERLAREQIEEWKKAIQNFQTGQVKQKDIAKRFDFRGAVAILFPQSALNFLQSIGVTTVYKYLSLRRTETGAACKLLATWREKCGLSEISSQGLLKYFLGISMRIETALVAIPPVNAEDRVWMQDPINSMTGAGRDFLIHDQKVHLASEFLESRTKELSEALETWRSQKGMEPLRGSGKVAMISAWKAQTKEVLESQQYPGRVIDLKAEIAGDELIVEEENVQSQQKKTKRSVESNKTSSLDGKTSRTKVIKQENKLPSRLSYPGKMNVEKQTVPPSYNIPYGVDDPFVILSSSTKKFLRTVGINTAYEFLSSRSTDIAEAFKHWRAAEGKSELKGLGAVASVSGWKAAVRKRAKEQGLIDLSEVEPHNNKVRKPLEPKSSEQIIRPKPPPSSDGVSTSKARIHTGHELMPRGRGLQEEGRCLFAVQRSGLPGQFVFELSLRSIADKSRLVITYKGMGPRVMKQSRTVTVEVRRGLNEAGSTIQKSRCDILSDAPVSANIAKLATIDSLTAFPPQPHSGSLIDLSFYQIYPTKRQDLSLFKEFIYSYVLKLDFAGTARSEGPDDVVSSNVLLHKASPGQYRYLLDLNHPIQAGQTVEVQFPTVAFCLLRGKHDDSKFRPMHLIDEAMRLLCVEDLRTLLCWLRCDLKKILTSPAESRRLFWVSRLLAQAICDNRKLPEDEENLRELLFERDIAKSVDDPAQQKLARGDIAKCISDEILWVLDYDVTCGHLQRATWCPKAQELIKNVVMIACDSYFVDSDAERTFKSLIKETLVWNDIRSIESVNDYIFPSFDNAAHGLKDVSNQENDGNDALTAENKSSNENLDSSKTERVVCTGPPTEEGRMSFVLCRPDAVTNGGKNLSSQWYQRFFCQIIHSTVAAFDHVLDSSERQHFQLEKVLLLLTKSPSPLVNPRRVRYKYPVVAAPSQPDFFPLSQELFLGIVWPAIRIGWHIEAGKNAREVVFYSRKRGRKRFGYAGNNTERKRSKLSREVSQFGVGKTTKTIKRLLGHVSKSHDNQESSDASAVKAKHVLDRFRAYVAEQLNPSVDEAFQSAAKLKNVVDAIASCFDTFAHDIFSSMKKIMIGDRSPIEVLGSECLVQFLFLMPSLLRHVEMSTDETEDCLNISRDLLQFIASNQNDFLEEGYRIPVEQYVAGNAEDKATFLESKLKTLQQENKANSNEASKQENKTNSNQASENIDKGSMGEQIVREEDKSRLTDFIATVMQQAVPFHATKEDVDKKCGRISLGAPGLVCRYCRGMNYEGRYFFSSVESLTACYTVLEKHCLKCPATPEEVKTQLALVRPLHSEQRKQLGTGTQQAFFTDLWNRFQQSKLGGAQIPNLMSDSGQLMDNDFGNWPETEITDHVTVLDHVRRNKAKLTKDVQEALDRYYSCLDFAGRIYMTDSMPRYFSEQWLVAKIVPKENQEQQATRLFIG